MNVVLSMLLLSSSLGMLLGNAVYAEGLSPDMEVGFSGREDEGDGIKDPENPDVTVAGEPNTASKERLRIDFAPKLSFSSGEVTDSDSDYTVKAQLFKDKLIPARGNFIQVSDYRTNPTGWLLQLRQEKQFTHTEKAGIALDGAVLSFDKSWTNSKKSPEYAPHVSKEIIRLTNVGETYNIAEADLGNGGGTWSIIFGASDQNKNENDPTLVPMIDDNGKPVMDSSLGKQIYTNSAIKLSIPGATKKEPGTYTTVLTWIISELP
ncbi:WxL domain-containing protein [Enterococcus plantarum]|nr:WxL domain-containing protein [Enterococcus plantarum]